MMKNIYTKNGSKGIYKGFTTSYYSSALGGYAFFASYKSLK